MVAAAQEAELWQLGGGGSLAVAARYWRWQQRGGSRGSAAAAQQWWRWQLGGSGSVVAEVAIALGHYFGSRAMAATAAAVQQQRSVSGGISGGSSAAVAAAAAARWRQRCQLGGCGGSLVEGAA